MKTVLCLIALAALCQATPPDTNLTGKWTGSFDTIDPDGSVHDGPALVNLTHKGAELTGTAGPDIDNQWPIANGKVDGSKVTFDVQRPQGQIIKFVLAVEGERLKGDASATDGDRNMKAKVDVTRAK
jgi:hypothetical protein